MKTKIYKSTNILSTSEFLSSIGATAKEVKKVIRSDYFKYSLDFKTYEYSFYEVLFN